MCINCSNSHISSSFALQEACQCHEDQALHRTKPAGFDTPCSPAFLLPSSQRSVGSLWAWKWRCRRFPPSAPIEGRTSHSCSSCRGLHQASPFVAWSLPELWNPALVCFAHKALVCIEVQMYLATEGILILTLKIKMPQTKHHVQDQSFVTVHMTYLLATPKPYIPGCVAVSYNCHISSIQPPGKLHGRQWVMPLYIFVIVNSKYSSLTVQIPGSTQPIRLLLPLR